MSVPFKKMVLLLEVRCNACSSPDDAIAASTRRWSVEGQGVGRGSGEMSSLLAADGRTSLMSSSEASRSSFRFNSFPIAPDDVSVESPARTRTGVGVADLAVFGLNNSYQTSQRGLKEASSQSSSDFSKRLALTVLVRIASPLPIFSISARHSAPPFTGP